MLITLSGCGNDAQFCDLCALLGMPELAADPKYKSNEDRVANRGELVSVLTRRLGEGTNAEWNGVFEGARFPYGAVNSLKEVFNDPQARLCSIHEIWIDDTDTKYRFCI